MALFIPEWNRGPGKGLQLRRTLGQLDDEFVIRMPMRVYTRTPRIFIQHASLGWMALAIHEATFSAVEKGQLFHADEQVAFEAFLRSFRDMEKIPSYVNEKLPRLVVLWSCSPEEARQLSAQYQDQYQFPFLSKAEFLEQGPEWITRLVAPLPEEGQSILAEFFPESEIPAEITTQRHFHRDNSARLARFFLDVQQEWASKLDLVPPQEQAELVRDISVRLVNGVAGSGKTLILLSRALILAEKFPSQRILLLIHNTPIVAVLKNQLHRTRGGVPPNLLIDTFFGWAVRQWWRSFGNFPKIQSPKETERMIWRLRRRYPELKVTEGLLAGELDFINESLFLEASQYYQASRAGRGFLLRLREREKLWELYREATAHLRKQELQMWSAVPRRLCLEGKQERLEKYHHVLIDEAQFFAPSWFQLIKLSSAEDVCIFVCADPNQGFLKRRLSWKSVGLEVSGRTKKLRRSYRTTRSILEAATQVLRQLAAEDPEDFLLPDYAGMHEGSKPLLLYSDSPQDAIERLVNELVEMKRQKGLVLGDLLVIYGDNIPRRMLYHKLSRRLAPDRVWWLNEEAQKKRPPGKTQEDYLRMAYLETATGLEASVVFLVGAEALYSEGRPPGTSDEEFAQGREERARKLYMAMTRAGQHLVLLSSQRLPAQMESLFQVLP